MIELPEAAVLARQINEVIAGKKIKNVIAARTPHKFAWYAGDPQQYNALLADKTINGANPCGGMVEVKADGVVIAFSDGVNLRYFRTRDRLPDKHQLLIEFMDGTYLVGSVQMYGGLATFPEGQYDNKYYLGSKAKPSPLTDGFNKVYFDTLFDPDSSKLSLKAFLATEQRIPGLGNGVLQDILCNAQMHPKKKISTLSEMDKTDLFNSIKAILDEMATKGGRDTEKDIFGNPGGYVTMLSKNTAGSPCPICGTVIKKEAYMGGSVYYCESCQKI